VSSHTVQFLSSNCEVVVPRLSTTMGLPQVTPPSIERLTSTSAADVPRRPRYEISQTLCLASKATEGSLTRA
jgi:hypothetical protein